MAVDWFSVTVQLTEIQCLYSRNLSTSITRPSPMNASLSFLLRIQRQTQLRCHLQEETQKRSGQSSCPFHLNDRPQRNRSSQLSQIQQCIVSFLAYLFTYFCAGPGSTTRKGNSGQQSFTTHLLSFAPQDVLRYIRNEGMLWPSFPTTNEGQ